MTINYYKIPVNVDICGLYAEIKNSPSLYDGLNKAREEKSREKKSKLEISF